VDSKCARNNILNLRFLVALDLVVLWPLAEGMPVDTHAHGNAYYYALAGWMAALIGLAANGIVLSVLGLRCAPDWKLGVIELRLHRYTCAAHLLLTCGGLILYLYRML
jgi:hypothetical protein